MSNVREELEKVAGITIGKKEDEEDYKKRLLQKLDSISKKEWAALTDGAQAWVNDSIEAINEDNDLPDFPESKKKDKKKAKDEDEDDKPAKKKAKKEEPEEAEASEHTWEELHEMKLKPLRKLAIEEGMDEDEVGEFEDVEQLADALCEHLEIEAVEEEETAEVSYTWAELHEMKKKALKTIAVDEAGIDEDDLEDLDATEIADKICEELGIEEEEEEPEEEEKPAKKKGSKKEEEKPAKKKGSKKEEEPEEEEKPAKKKGKDEKKKPFERKGDGGGSTKILHLTCDNPDMSINELFKLSEKKNMGLAITTVRTRANIVKEVLRYLKENKKLRG